MLCFINWHGSSTFVNVFWKLCFFWYIFRGRRGRVRMMDEITTTYALSAYHHLRCEFETRSWQGVLNTTLCDKSYQWLATGRWTSPGTPASSTNKTNCYDITDILLKVALNSTTITLAFYYSPSNHKLLNSIYYSWIKRLVSISWGFINIQ
jgi:hypothetical protein